MVERQSGAVWTRYRASTSWPGRCRYRDQSGGKLFLRKDNGLVRDVFQQRHMQQFGNVGIGHVRYPTAGSSSSAEAQPFYVNSPYGITLAHNGNLTNVEQLTQEIYASDLRHVNTNSGLGGAAQRIRPRVGGTRQAQAG